MHKRVRKYQWFFLLMIILSTTIAAVFMEKSYAATEYPYMIMVNKQQNCVTVYKKDEEGKYTVPMKAMVCSTGTATPLGTYNTKVRYRWKILKDDVWGQYSTRITGSILFHSVWYYKQDPSTLSATQYNKLGTTCSHGCIRLTVEDAKWIYDNCLVGTTVTIYNAKDPGPLGKPTARKLKAGTGWDPTDPNPENPWLNAGPTILGTSNQKVKWGSKFTPLDGVTAITAKGLDITDKIIVSGKVNTKEAGTYKVTYSVKDSGGKKAKETVKITVLECPATIKFKGITDRYVNPSTNVDKSFCMKGVKVYFGKEKLSNDSVEVTVEDTDDGYEIVYEATGKDGKTVSQIAHFTLDEEPPVIEAEHELFYEPINVDREFVLKQIKVYDDITDMTEDRIETDIVQVCDRGWLVTITATDEAGNVKTTKVQYSQSGSVDIEGARNHTYLEGTVIDKKYVMKGITGIDIEKDVTENVEVTISEPEEGVYTVTYELTNRYGSYMKVIVYYSPEDSEEVEYTYGWE